MILRTYQGRPVRHMRQVPDGILLTFVSPIKGKPGEQRTITQADWERYGSKQSLPRAATPDLRKLAAQAEGKR